MKNNNFLANQQYQMEPDYKGRYASEDTSIIYNMPGKFSFDASRVVPTAEENRPVNKAVRYFIKAK